MSDRCAISEGLSEACERPRFPMLKPPYRLHEFAHSKGGATEIVLPVFPIYFHPRTQPPPFEMDKFSANSIGTGAAPESSVSNYFFRVSDGRVRLKFAVHAWIRMPKEAAEYFEVGGKISKLSLFDDALRQIDQGFLAQHAFTRMPDINQLLGAVFVTEFALGEELDQSNANTFRSATFFRKGTPDQVVVEPEICRVCLVPNTIRFDRRDRIGVLAHELGHLLAFWPDLYKKTSPGSVGHGVGKYCVMGLGHLIANTLTPSPCLPCAPMRMNQGWIDVIDAPDGKLTTVNSLRPATLESPQCIEIVLPDPCTRFVIEFRQHVRPDGTWTDDYYLAESGFAIYLIDNESTGIDMPNPAIRFLKYADSTGVNQGLYPHRQDWTIDEKTKGFSMRGSPIVNVRISFSEANQVISIDRTHQ